MLAKDIITSLDAHVTKKYTHRIDLIFASVQWTEAPNYEMTRGRGGCYVRVANVASLSVGEHAKTLKMHGKRLVSVTSTIKNVFVSIRP